jgi:hypothetical protein
MRLYALCGLMMALFISAMPCMAERIFYDNFENDIYTKNNWKQGAGQLNWELSNKYNHTSNGKTSLKIEPKSMQVTDDVYHVIVEHPKPAHVRFWFYERGWKNKVKVDQQYVLIGDGTTSEDSANFCQIGQTGNPAHEGHYSIFDFAANAWFYDTKTTSNEPRWVKMEFVILKDGTAKILIDDTEEYTFTQKWTHLGTIGLMSYGNNTRGGVLDGYWDDVEVFDTEDAPTFAVDSLDKAPSLWGKIKSGFKD